jgi:hypothetical protein
MSSNRFSTDRFPFARFQVAMERIDAAHVEDPNREPFEGEDQPAELLYARRMTGWLERIEPDASEALRLAARCQHLRRWTIPRDDYPRDRRGYLAWRNAAKRMHAETAGEILAEAGYGPAEIGRVQDLVLKRRFKADPEAQTLEDVVCVVFLESYFADFAPQYDEEKVVDILRKTWAKMSPRGHQAALGLELPGEARALVEKALASAS